MKGKKWRDVRNALVMVIVMVAMMSSATFAWFTMTSSPTVTGLEMTAGTSDGLKVCETSGGTYVNAITIASQNSDLNKKLTPVSVQKSNDGVTYAPQFYEPLYVGDKVTGLKTSALDEAKLNGHVVKYTYYLKTDPGTDTVNVGIVTADPALQVGQSGVEDDKAKLPGSFVRTKDSSEKGAARAIRVGIVVNNKMYIYEPNNENTKTSSSVAPTDITQTPKAHVVSDESSGKITNDGVGAVSANDLYTSKGLFEVGESAVPVTMYIWLEGTDDDCGDEIKSENLEAQIQFTVVGEMGTFTNP